MNAKQMLVGGEWVFVWMFELVVYGRISLGALWIRQPSRNALCASPTELLSILAASVYV